MSRPAATSPSLRRRGQARGLTLIEVLVSIGVLAVIATLIYGAFDGMSRSRKGLARIGDRYHQGRGALARMAREIQSAFLSRHLPLDKNQAVRLTAFVGQDSRPTDRLDFTAFAHRRLARNAHESDQCEIGYFASRDPEQSDKIDLVRREARDIDIEPTKGGIVNVLAEDIESFDIQYFDPITADWTDAWDSTQPAGQYERLPMQVWITLVIRGGAGDKTIKLETKVPVAQKIPIDFAATSFGGGK